MITEPETLDAVEKAAAEKGAPVRNKTHNSTRSGKSDDARGAGAGHGSPPRTWDVPTAD